MFNFIKKLFFNVREIKKAKEKELLKKKGVCGVGISNNKIVVLVEKKKPIEDLNEKDLVPSSIEGFETKVIEVGEITASVSGCPQGGTACSIAGICYKNGESYYLQNSHCLFNSVGKNFLIPSPLDGGKAKDKVGIVSEQNQIKSTGNKIDALIAKTDIPQNSSIETDIARIGDNVEFTGRTSGKRLLKVIADDITINVNYAIGTCQMVNQIMLEGIVRGGDSGSALMKNGKICGLVFASNNANFAFANHIQNVIDEMGISFKKTEEKKWRFFKLSETTGKKNDTQIGTIADLQTELVDFIDEVRYRVGFAMKVNSGYREASYNKKIGGALNSSHITRWAVDIAVKNTSQADSIIRACYEVEKEKYGKKRLQIGVKCKSGESGYVHIGLDPERSSGVLWTY